jgi:hypothetical protein
MNQNEWMLLGLMAVASVAILFMAYRNRTGQTANPPTKQATQRQGNIFADGQSRGHELANTQFLTALSQGYAKQDVNIIADWIAASAPPANAPVAPPKQ